MTEAIPMTTTTAATTVNSESPPPPPPRRRDRDRRDDRDSDRRRDHHRSSPPLREREYKRRLSPSPPPPYRDRRGRSPPPSFKRSRRDEGGYDDRRGSPRGGGYGRGERRERDYKRRFSPSSPPPYRDRRGRSPPPSFKRSRRDEGGYDDRRGSSRGVGYGRGERRFGYGQYDRDQGGRGGYGDERSHGRYGGRSGGYQNWGGRGGYDAPNAGNSQREGLMSYKQFIQELEDDVLPSEAERRYQEYKSEFISTQKRAFFDAHKDEEWLKDKYHPTNLVSVIERRNELAQKNAKDFLLDLQSGTLDLGPGLNNPSGSPNSDEDADVNNKKRRHGRSHANLSGAPKAHPVSSEPRRIQIDIEQSQALVRKLDSEKGVEDNILSRSDNDRSSRDKAHGSSGPVVIVRGLASVKGLEGVELLDTLITYLWRIHGVDYYGLIESGEPKGLRHVRIEGKSNDGAINGAEWEKKLDTRWEERLRGQDPLEVMSAKEKLDSAAVEALDPNVRKIRDEKYGWKYGCGAKGCTKLFHAAEFVHKHLKLKHPELVIELTSKVREDLYFQNYMDDVDAPGGTPVMQPSIPKERPLRRRPMENRLKDDRRIRDDRDNDRTDKSHNMNDGTAGGNGDDLMYDSFGQQGLQPFPSDMAPPPVLMPVPGAGPLGPFVPAPPEVAMRMMREQGGGPSPFDGSGRNGRAGQQPLIALPQGFRQDPRRLRSYNDLDAPDEEVTVIDYRSL